MNLQPVQYSHVMVDLETMGNRPGCPVVAIGAVFFSQQHGLLGPEFYRKVDLESCVRVGLKLDTSTVLWWMEQSDEARRELYTGERVPLSQALCELSQFLATSASSVLDQPLRVWGNGANFDNPILVAAYEACQLFTPWKFWNDRCYRTIKSLRPDIKIPRTGTHHNALHDAKSQARHLLDVANALNITLQ